MTPVALVAMPVASPHHPNLALGLLKAQLAKRQIACDVHNFYLSYPAFVGLDDYSIVADDSFYKAMLGEWVFAASMRPRQMSEELAFWTNVMQREYGDRTTPERILAITRLRASASKFVESCFSSVEWQEYKIVGFTSSFQQNLASLALAKMIKAAFPNVLIVFGGANCEGEMGAALLDSCPFVDVVFSGEADISFPDFVSKVLAAPAKSSSSHRVSEPIWASEPVHLDDLPYPDFSDFYAQREQFPAVDAAFQAVPLFESARGCWWGAKRHCTFCGLNGSSMAFRSKSQTRAYEELSSLGKRYGHEVLVVDNILDFGYFDEFIPKLARHQPRFLLHYETKVNLSAAKIQLLAQAGIRKIQPGIESLSTRILGIMDKGCSLFQNVQTLKLAAEAGIYVEWGFLYGFPGESASDYTEIARIIPKLTHLQPPSGITKVRADRFSPYHSRPQLHGITVHPLPAYSYIYDMDGPSIARIAYHFEIENSEVDRCSEYVTIATELVQRWNSTKETQQLFVQDNNNGLGVVVSDTREVASASTIQLTGLVASVLSAAAEGSTILQLQRTLNIERQELDAALAFLDELNLVLIESGKVLSLPLRQPGYRRAPRNIDIRSKLSNAFYFSSLRPATLVGQE